MLIAGKGHEKVQVSREGSVPFDDVRGGSSRFCGRAGYECRLGKRGVGQKA